MLRPADAISMHYIRSENMEELGDSIKEMLPKFKNSLQHLYKGLFMYLFLVELAQPHRRCKSKKHDRMSDRTYMVYIIIPF